MPVVTDNDNSDSDTVVTWQLLSLRRCYPKKLLKKRGVPTETDNIMSTETEDVLINSIRESPFLYPKGLSDYKDTQKRSRLLAKKLLRWI